MMTEAIRLEGIGLRGNAHQQCNTRSVMLGLVVALVMAGTVVLSAMMFPANQGIAFLSIIIIPFLISFRLTGNLVDALTIVWLNEVYFGVGGTWLKIGPVPGRGLLLTVVILAYIVFSHVRFNIHGIIKKRSFYIIFYGFLFPLFLFIYSVFVYGVAASSALGDVMRFGTVLMYFPIRDLLRRNMDVSLGWIIGATIIMAFLFATMSMGPGSIRNSLLVNWMSSGDVESQFNQPNADFVRAALTPIVFCLVGVFLGIMYLLDSKGSYRAQLFGWILTVVSIAPFVITFIRGLLAGIAVSLIMILCLSVLRFVHWVKIVRLLLISGILLLLGYWISVVFIPMSLTKWNIAGQGVTEIVDPVRIEQSERMINEWLEAPLLGKGAGAPVRGYSRVHDQEEGLAFEVQYLMALYRTGILGFVIIIAPFILVVIRTIRMWCQGGASFSTHIVKFQFASAFALIALLAASCVNPYFATVMTPLFIVLFFALDEISKLYQAHDAIRFRW